MKDNSVARDVRDPRANPIAGDVLRKRNVDYEVQTDSQKCFCVTKRPFGRHGVRIDGYSHRDDWIKWAKTAEIVKRANTATYTCEDCPPVGYPTDKTRCTECPRSS